MMITKEVPDTAVLRSLRLKGRAGPAGIAVATGLTKEVVLATLEKNATKGFVVQRTGRISGWLLTPAGKQHTTQLLDAEKAGVDTSTPSELYDTTFLELNHRFKTLCTRWQLAQASADELAEIHAENLALLELFGAHIPRFSTYRPRFAAAFDRVVDGEAAALLQPLTDSYHDVWLELHEDLLIMLDRRREEED